jgi:hypothetical protein
MRRVHRSVAATNKNLANYANYDMENESAVIRKLPTSNSSSSNCYSNLNARVTTLESEVSALQSTVTSHDSTLADHEARIATLENSSSSSSNNYPFRTKAKTLETGRNMHMDNTNSTSVSANNLSVSNLSLDNTSSVFERRPPIIFDGYSVNYRSINVNGANYYFWFLLPVTSPETRVYIFNYSTSAGKYLYEPVNPLNLAEKLQITQTTPGYIYDNLAGYGWSLVPILGSNSTILGADPSPFNIIGYRYLNISGVGYAYVPSSTSTGPIVSTNTVNSPVKFLLAPYTYSYYASSTYYIKPYYYFDNVTNPYKFPFVTYDDSTNGSIAANTIPMGGSVGYLLPNNLDSYTVTIRAKLCINKDAIAALYGASNLLGIAPYAEIYYEQSLVDKVLGVTNTSGTAGRVVFTQEDLILDSNSSTYKLYDNEYYMTDFKYMSEPLEIYAPQPSDASPLFGRRVLTVRTDVRFSIIESSIIINKI